MKVFYIFFGDRSGGLGDRLSRFIYLYTLIKNNFPEMEYVCVNDDNMQHSSINFNKFLGLNNIFKDNDDNQFNEIDLKLLINVNKEDRIKKIRDMINSSELNIKFDAYNFYVDYNTFFEKSDGNFLQQTKKLIINSYYDINKELINNNNNNVIIHARREDLTYCIQYNNKYYVFNFMITNLAEKSDTNDVIEWLKNKIDKQRVLFYSTIEKCCELLKNRKIIIMTDGFKNLYQNFSKHLSNCHEINSELNEINYISTPDPVINIITNNCEFDELKKKYDNICVAESNNIHKDMLLLINSKIIISSSSLFISTAMNYFNFNSTMNINYKSCKNENEFYQKIELIQTI
jgi:hypothetical protein